MPYLTPIHESTDIVSDASLLASIAESDASSFEILMKRHQKKIFHFAHKYVRDLQAAEDITQETFTRVYLNARQYNPEFVVSTWIFNITLNLCRDHGRRQKVRRWFLPGKYKVDSSISENLPDLSDNVENLLVLKQRLATLEIAIDNLPHDLKAALILFHVEENSQEQCSKKLGISPKAVETRVYRARKHLRKILGNLVEG